MKTEEMDRLISSWEYVDLDTACEWLRHLVKFPISLPNREFMGWCELYSIPVYIDCNALEGATLHSVGSRSVARNVIGIGFCQVDFPVSAYEAFEPHNSGGIEVTGIAIEFSDKDEPELSHISNWKLTNLEGRPFLLIPDDIKRLAMLLKPAHNAEAEHIQGREGKIVSPRCSINEQRLQIIRRWFGEQQEYDAAQLSRLKAGLPGARDACWQWLTKSGLTARGELFNGAAQNKSSKSKKFVSAWNAFLKEMILD